MKFLIYGAGVIGSIFACKLEKAGNDVTVLARGSRYSEIANHGITIQDVYSKYRSSSKVKVIKKLDPDDYYDYIMVIMQKTQVDSILYCLKENCSPNIVFIVNNAVGYEKWARIIGDERLMIGFPSAGGERREGLVNYFIGRGITRLFQTTTFGEYNRERTSRIIKLIRAFNKARIPSVFCKDMDAWQKYHVSIVTCIANILYKYNGNNYELSKSSKDVRLMIKGIKEGFSVLAALGYPVTPFKLNYFKLPESILLMIFKNLMGSKIAEITMSKHAMVAIEEMYCLQHEFDTLIIKSNIKTQGIDELKGYLRSQVNKINIEDEQNNDLLTIKDHF